MLSNFSQQLCCRSVNRSVAAEPGHPVERARRLRGGRVANGPVQDRPTAGYERCHACGPDGVERLPLGRRDDRRSTYVGGHVARSAARKADRGV
jgi:hypothetical protein